MWFQKYPNSRERGLYIVPRFFAIDGCITSHTYDLCVSIQSIVGIMTGQNSPVNCFLSDLGSERLLCWLIVGIHASGLAQF